MSKKSQRKKDKKSPGEGGQSRTIAENRRARHKFEISEKIECGIVLAGSEVKSLRDGKISLDEAYVRVHQGELWLVGANIAEYNQASIWNHDPNQHRKLLVHRAQLRKLQARSQEKGLTLVPLTVFFNVRGIVKIIVGVGRGKKLYDKRDSLKDADARRHIDRAMKQRGR